MEIVRSQNARAISEFYLHEIFHEGAIFEKISIFLFVDKKTRDEGPDVRVLVREPG